MWPFPRRPRVVEPAVPRLRELAARLDDVEAEQDHIKVLFKRLAIRITTHQRTESRQDALGSTSDPLPDHVSQLHPPAPTDPVPARGGIRLPRRNY